MLCVDEKRPCQALARNRASCREDVSVYPALPEWAWRLRSDPQTSGGLLVS